MRNKTLLLSALLALATTAFGQISSPTGKINGHEYVDLGLSVLWATCNVGASSPGGYGNYYAWGETVPKSSYTEYNRSGGSLIGNIVGNSTYDAARSNWGGTWRLPTIREIDELIKKCQWTWTSVGGHAGYKVTGPNGNSIFLPAAGYCDVTSLRYAGESGNYWSATTYDDSGHAISLCFDSGDLIQECTPNKWYGYSVRAVSDTKTQTGTINDHGYVDLGLSVKWATCNVGTSSPEGYGSYFAWGETSAKSKFNYSRTYNVSMGSIAGDPRFDAATANWGGTWRLPTASEIDELKNKCQWTWTTMGGHNGYKVTGPSGNSIFLPAAGWYNNESQLYYAGSNGGYWSATPYESNNQDAYELFFDSGKSGRYWATRYGGRSVRAVSGKVTQPPTPPKEQVSSPTGTINNHGYVDLGLSVKWATCNVGAISPGGYGNYYAWGETSTKSKYTERNSSTYKKKKIGSIAGNPKYDAARANWGGTWRLPTTSEIKELVNKCKWEWTTIGGHAGYKVTGPNGNSIFLPAAGYRYETSLRLVGEEGQYWSATLFDKRYPKYADCLEFRNNIKVTTGLGWTGRYRGYSVRPVSE